MIMCVPVHYNENSHQSVAIEARCHIHLGRMCKAAMLLSIASAGL